MPYGICSLFFATWGTRHCGGITLELSAHSPSDAIHCCKPLQRRINDTAWKRTQRGQPQRYYDPAHGWMKRRTVLPDLDTALRIFGHPEGLKFDRRASSARKLGTLPEVRTIQSICIRRQFLRALSATDSLAAIFRSTPEITNFRYEAWRGQERRNHIGAVVRNTDHHFLLLNIFRQAKHLKRVSLYEDRNEFLYGRHARGVSPLLGQDLARTRHNFEELHVGKLIDARDFFYEFWPVPDALHRQVRALERGRRWECLRFLSLFSCFLSPNNYRTVVAAASKAAKLMPRLEIMELWMGSRIDLDAEQIQGRACILQYLDLKERLLNETSLLQIQEEGDN